MQKRRNFLDSVDFVNRLQQVGEHRRASLMLRDTGAEIDRLHGDMAKAERLREMARSGVQAKREKWRSLPFA